MTIDAVTSATKGGAALAVPLHAFPGSSAIQEARARALALFDREGLPHRRIEDWKYTDLRALMRELAPIAPVLDAASRKRADALVAAHRIKGTLTIALVDGVLVSELSDLKSLDAGVSVSSLAAAVMGRADISDRIPIPSDQSNAMSALNLALMSDGAVIDIAEATAPSQPIHVLHIATSEKPAAIYTRSLVRIGARAKVTLVESFAGEGGAYQVNDAIGINVGAHATLDHVRFMLDGTEAFNISTASISVGEHANVRTFNMTVGGSVSRYQAFVKIDGLHTHLQTAGVNLLRGKQHGDTTLFVDHALPDGTSREMFRAVLDDRAHSVFQGRIVVQPKAQKTDAKMMTRALLLTDEAEADNKPELEIFADDVSCGHGATSGALDESLLFYLRARGLTETQAQALLIQAFVGEAIETIADERLRDIAVAAAERWLAERG